MNTYWRFWKRGWWAWLFAFCANISMAILLVPLAFAFRDNSSLYVISALVAWLVVGAPLWGLLFERFAAGSTRILTADLQQNTAD